MNLIVTAGNRKKVTVTATAGAKVRLHKSPPKKVQLTVYRDGLTAYELAVKNGYTGTEVEFVSGMIEEDTDFLTHYILSKN